MLALRSHRGAPESCSLDPTDQPATEKQQLQAQSNFPEGQLRMMASF